MYFYIIAYIYITSAFCLQRLDIYYTYISIYVYTLNEALAIQHLVLKMFVALIPIWDFIIKNIEINLIEIRKENVKKQSTVGF